MKCPNRNATFRLFGRKNSSVGERLAARGGTTRPDERIRHSFKFKEWSSDGNTK